MTGFSDPLAGKFSANNTTGLVSEEGPEGGGKLNTALLTPEESPLVSQSEVAQAGAEAVKSVGGLNEDDSLVVDDKIPGGGEGEGEIIDPDELEPPKPPTLVAPGKISTTVDLSILLSALQLTEQKAQAEKTVEQIKSDAKDRAVESDKQLKEIQDKAKDMEKSKVLGLFTKIFSAIGAVLGIIAGVLSMAAGIATGGNPLLIIGGIMAIVASVDALMSVASDGKVSISAGITKALEAMGVDSETAQWVAFAIQMAMVVATVAVGFASGGGGAMSAIANLGSMIAKSTKALSVIQSVVQASGSGVNIGKGVVDSGIKESEAKVLDIDAVMKKLQQNIGILQSLLEQQISNLNNLVDGAKDLVEEKSKTLAAIQRGVMS